MATGITTTGVLPSPVQQAFSYKLLLTPVPNMIHGLCASEYTMPRNNGIILRMRRYNKLDDALVPLGNSGAPVPPQTLTAVDVDAEISFYGTYIILNQQVTLQNNDPVLNASSTQLGISFRTTEDKLLRNMLMSSATALNCVSGFNGDTPTNLSRSDIDNAVSVLLGNNAFSLSDQISGENRFGTGPVRNAYFSMSHTDLTRSFDGISGFLSKTNYPSPMNIIDSEWGSIGNLRFLVSSIGAKTPGASNFGNAVYDNIITGFQGYGRIKQDGYSARFIYRPAVLNDALAQNATAGYTFAQASAILNDTWVVRLRCTI